MLEQEGFRVAPEDSAVESQDDGPTHEANLSYDMSIASFCPRR
ncbi:MAG: hypothetical protein ACRD8W_01250 [Nitrososphaeraceae archaeon]